MSNIKTTIWLDTLTFENECHIDFLFREGEFCGQISALDGRILMRKFEKVEDNEMTQCPNCGSINYFQPEDACEIFEEFASFYPILECIDCGERWWSD